MPGPDGERRRLHPFVQVRVGEERSPPIDIEFSESPEVIDDAVLFEQIVEP